MYMNSSRHLDFLSPGRASTVILDFGFWESSLDSVGYAARFNF